MAWLGAKPDKQSMTRMEAIKTRTPFFKKGEDSDEESQIIAPTEIHLPDIPTAFEYLLGLFFSSGQAHQTGYGLVPLTWQELRAFRKENELELLLWERNVLKKMSEAYCSEYAKASDPRRPAPYKPESDELEEVDQVAKAITIMEGFSAFRQRKK